jgi:peptide/nickel transport system permease protein
VTLAGIGVMAGFFRGRIDFAASFVADSVLAFPPLILLLAVVAAVRPNAATSRSPWPCSRSRR